VHYFSYLLAAVLSLLFQDWPPQKDFRVEFPELFDAFAKALPCRDLAALNGVLNMAAHLPKNGVIPDLGTSCSSPEATTARLSL
jgi:hypothetical protein